VTTPPPATATTPPAGSAEPTATLTSTVKVTVTTATVTRTSTESSAAPGKPPAATKEPAPVTGSCPYLPETDAETINGQRSGPTQLTDVEPYPICDFYRSDGGWMARIRIIKAKTPAQAQAAVDQHVPIADSAPASQPPGWTGGSMSTPNGIAGNPEVASIYAVSKGNIAIVAESNQAQSIKGRQMVIEVVQKLGL
jgi:hypothetical protein